MVVNGQSCCSPKFLEYEIRYIMQKIADLDHENDPRVFRSTNPWALLAGEMIHQCKNILDTN
jgi:hypothetical protein